MDDNEVGDGVDVDVLGESEEESEDSGKDHSQRQEVAKVHSLGKHPTLKQNIRLSNYLTRLNLDQIC